MKNSCAATAGIVAAVVAGVTAGAAPTRADTWSEQVLAAHNAVRAQYGAAPLTWSSDLYPGVLRQARSCRFPDAQWPVRYGENLFATRHPSAGIAEAVASWMQEMGRYDYANPGFSPATGRFTQLVWKSTTQVAAAVMTCPPNTVIPGYSGNATYIVARYTPPGNFPDRFRENVSGPAAFR
ncbi:CAP family protein [Nocardia paucivorans]|uniref:CAP family protein n=1 Tax=Nocardia paucivorans TaxID=114259 RepID=UPI0002F9095C|nr:CAP family protein [Nocardia paucivorans]